MCALWGKVLEAQPPYLVMLITVEPLESQLRHDRRFLNLWIKDISCITTSPRLGGWCLCVSHNWFIGHEWHYNSWSVPYSSYFSDCRAGQVMVHKALNLLESRLPPLLVRRLVGLPFWLYFLSLTFVLPEIRSSRWRAQERHSSWLRILWISEACNGSQAKPPCSRGFTLHPGLVILPSR